METNSVLFKLNEGIATITINNPAKRNALSTEIVQAMTKHLYECNDNDNVRVIMLQGAEGNFCGGGDVKSMKLKNDSNTADTRPGIRVYSELIRAITNNEKIVVAKLEGAVAGGGISIAMACDFSYATDDAIFSFAFVNIGFVPDMGSTKLLLQNVGLAKAKELMLLGNRFTGKEAAQWGIITGSYPIEELEIKVTKKLEAINNGPSTAYTRIKTLLNRMAYQGLTDSIEEEAKYQYELCKTEDHKEAINAFLEKRKPQFKK